MGVEDSGRIKGLGQEQLESTLAALTEVASKIPASLTHIDKIALVSGLWVAEVLIQATIPTSGIHEIRVALFGPSGVGKTTLMAVLSKGQLDNGHGSARLSLLHHRHEMLSGRTSTVAVASIAMNERGEVISACENEFGDPPSLVDQHRWLGAPVHLNLFDLAGADRYCRTALCSLASPAGPDLVLLLTDDPDDWRIRLLKALHIPHWLIHSKCDLTGKTEGVSAVTGQGISELLQRLHQYSMQNEKTTTAKGNTFLIERVSQQEGEATILYGTVLCGQIQQGHSYRLGDTLFMVNSIQRNRISVPFAKAPQMVSLSIDTDTMPQKGMLLTDTPFTHSSSLQVDLTLIHQFHSPDLKGHRYPLQGTAFVNGGRCKATLSDANYIQLDEPIFLISPKCIFLGDNGFLYAGLAHNIIDES